MTDAEAVAWVPSLPAEVVEVAEGEGEVVAEAPQPVVVVEAAEGAVVAAEGAVVVDAGEAAGAGDVAAGAGDDACDEAGAVAAEVESAVGADAHSCP